MDSKSVKSSQSTNRNQEGSEKHSCSHEDSPIKDVIASYNLHAENLNEFDIAKVLDWDSNNMKQYKQYIRRFDNYNVLLNLMHLDKQLQDLRSNYKYFRNIRESQKDLNNFAFTLQENMNKFYPKYEDYPTITPNTMRNNTAQNTQKGSRNHKYPNNLHKSDNKLGFLSSQKKQSQDRISSDA